MGKLAEVKTKETDASVENFINGVKGEQKQKDSLVLLKMMERISGEKPKIWGSSIIGFGKMVYKSPASGREVEWFKIGFSPRKASLSLYLSVNIQSHASALKNLGKYKTGVGCLYVNKLDDIDLNILEEMMVATIKGKQ